MNDRIKELLNAKQISPSELADSIGVQRSNVSHVINGRNKPSFQFIEKLLHFYPTLSAKWLILGEGPMFEEDNLAKESKSEPDLFTELPISSIANETITIKENPVKVTEPVTVEEKVEQKSAEHLHTGKSGFVNAEEDSKTKKIERVIVFYSDQTFDVYNPSK
jgi:transcriptional regulator with XRE-family HTH domain